MEWREFIASLVGSLAWPAAAVVVVVLLRRQIASLVEGQLTRLKAGPVELEWERTAAEVAESVTVTTAGFGEDDEEIARLTAIAAEAPHAAIIEAFRRVEREMHELANARGIILPRNATARVIANQMEGLGVISEQTASAVQGLATIRNLAVHGEADETPERAREFIAMAQAVLFALHAPQREGPAPSAGG